MIEGKPHLSLREGQAPLDLPDLEQTGLALFARHGRFIRDRGEVGDRHRPGARVPIGLPPHAKLTELQSGIGRMLAVSREPHNRASSLLGVERGVILG